MAPKAKAASKRNVAKQSASAQFRRMMKNGSENMTKEQLRAEYDKQSGAQKKEWRAKWDQLKHFDWVETSKTVEESNSKEKKRGYVWMTRPQIYVAEGYTTTNKNPEAKASAEALMQNAAKMRKWTKAMSS